MSKTVRSAEIEHNIEKDATLKRLASRITKLEKMVNSLREDMFEVKAIIMENVRIGGKNAGS